MEFKGRARIRSHLDIAPLIDIVFLLLIFFMLTSTFLKPEAIELELPKSSSSNISEITPIVVSLSKTGLLALNEKSIELEQLKIAIIPLLKQHNNASIILKSDAGCEVQQLLGVMDEIRNAGGSNISLAVVRK